ncbi:hypothetical protein [Micromonospora noduli]|nr:hypothetical protein [Micromonospora noduli]
MTNWVTTGVGTAGRPRTAADRSNSSALLLTQLIDGWWFLQTEAITVPDA